MVTSGSEVWTLMGENGGAINGDPAAIIDYRMDVSLPFLYRALARAA
jgi:hypothetical protein